MAAHVCSTECKCGHWRPGRRVRLPEAGRRRGGWSLDILDGVPDDNPSTDYSLYEDYEPEEEK